ncbi:MAG: 3-dehydroquinate synthase [Planctomycetota bacterium]
MNASPEPLPHLIDVDLGDRSYRITIGSGHLDDVGTICREALVDRHAFVITDSNVGPIYLDRVTTSLGGTSKRVDVMTMEAGESTKSLANCQRIWQQMLHLAADRSSIVVALGGGVIGDLGGFVAAAFARGIDFVQIPTSLLAQVDSSVGGKVGINLPGAKNMVGAFWQPRSVLIDTDVLSTLDQRNYVAGLAEVIKYGLIMDLPFFEYLEKSVSELLSLDSETLARVIARCCQCKTDVVEADEREQSGRRAILNYGHTYGHAIEAVFGYGTFLHGEAISIGMTCAGRLAVQLGLVDSEFLKRQTELFRAVGLPVDCPSEKHDELIDAMARDKKVSKGQLNLILPTKIGHVESIPAPNRAEILTSLKPTD